MFVSEVESYINKTWKRFKTQKELSLHSLFSEPQNKGLKHIWRYGHADLSVFKNNGLCAIIEVGGGHHYSDEKQVKNDRRKYILAKKNNVNCIFIMNDVFSKISNRQKRKLIGSLIFKWRTTCQESEKKIRVTPACPVL